MIVTLENFLVSLKKGEKYLPLLQIFIEDETTEKIKDLAEALKNEKCPIGVAISFCFSLDSYSEDIPRIFADALKSGKYPQGFQLDLSVNKRATESVKILADALKSGKCPQGFQLRLSDNTFGLKGINALISALTSGKCPRGLQLNFDAKDFGSQGIRILSAALASGLCPPELQINFSGLEHSVGEVERRQLESAWATYHNDQQRKEFLASLSFFHGRLQSDSPVRLLNPDVINHIFSFVSPIPVIDKSTKFSAEAFVESYQKKIPPDEKSPAGKELFSAITWIDKKANISERARIIRNAVSEATERKEGKLSSSEIALLQRFHLIPEPSTPLKTPTV